MKAAIGLDIGTTAIKCMAVGEDGRVLASSRRDLTRSFPHPGWTEQDPVEILDLSVSAIRDAMASCEAHISSLGIAHQGETCLVWNRTTGRPLYPAITWQDRREARKADELSMRKGEEIERRTGIKCDSYYSAFKIRWMLDTLEIQDESEVLAGTLNTWLVWNLTKGKVFATDEGSSCCTLLRNPRETGWSGEMLEIFSINEEILPSILDSDSFFGFSDPSFFGYEIPILASLIDSAAAMVASGVLSPGDFISTYGTGNFIHLVTDGFVEPADGLTSSIAFSRGGIRRYQLNGICYSAGSAINWLRDSLGLFCNDDELTGIMEGENRSGVFFVPALDGIATPYWRGDARGSFFGLAEGTEKKDLVRAVLESSALQVAHTVSIMERMSGISPKVLTVMGGMTRNDALMRYQAGLLGIDVVVPKESEPAFGSALFALGKEKDEIQEINGPDRIFHPSMDGRQALELKERWLKAVESTLLWHGHMIG